MTILHSIRLLLPCLWKWSVLSSIVSWDGTCGIEIILLQDIQAIWAGLSEEEQNTCGFLVQYFCDPFLMPLGVLLLTQLWIVRCYKFYSILHDVHFVYPCYQYACIWRAKNHSRLKALNPKSGTANCELYQRWIAKCWEWLLGYNKCNWINKH